MTAGACGLQHKAFLALAAGKFSAAVELFREALKLEPTNLAFATNMALSELYNGQLLKAVETLESVSPSFAPARVLPHVCCVTELLRFLLGRPCMTNA